MRFRCCSNPVSTAALFLLVATAAAAATCSSVVTAAGEERAGVLPAGEQEAVYRVLEAINPSLDWRFLYPDDLCLSGPHDVIVPHVVELNFGYVSDFSPNPPCGVDAVFSPRLSSASFPFLRKLFFYGCFNASSEVSLPEDFFRNLPSAFLEELVFVENPSLTGRLSGRIGSFVRLRRLVLTGSRISGEIPYDIGNLRNLQELTLSRNRLKGRLPRSVGRCTGLQILDVSDNQLAGHLPAEIGQLDALLKLDLSENHISGPVPGELAGLQRLEFLDLSHNNLTGGVPVALAAMAELKEVHLSGNPLGGRLPEEIWEKLGGLLGLGMSGVGLVGNIPSSMGVFLGRLCYLALDNNGLEGGLPEEFRRMERTAREINLENNMLSGRLPFSAAFVARIGRKLKLSGNLRLCLEGDDDRRQGGAGSVSSLEPCDRTEVPRPAFFLPLSSGGRCSRGPRGGPFLFSFALLHLILVPSLFALH
ncbi:unnamed protein product [Spirodela intermedia]|uniref:Uncharacterized protein n=1 Tax=Spirodela intermedia TaxID=51605 RepID=A0A7I8J9L5_SPIIN|nr:unnamed protein product [Spirodela intermedia]CAA6666455.1 unnamed protein product [Spirodela intermedia]